MKISCVINVDTRPQRNEQTGLFNGVVSNDFLTDGIYNKIKFLDGFEKEIIVSIDEHNPVSDADLAYLRRIADVVLLRKHTTEEKFNDWNYWRALALCSGDIIMHFDQDCTAFTSNRDNVQELINMLNDYSYISYPSHWSPQAVHDPEFDYMWCSTRFFICKRNEVDFTELKKCLEDYDYLYSTYPASRRHPWTEHCLGLIAKYKGKGVYYPPIDLSKLAIFVWENYETYTLKRLNEQSYEEIENWIKSKGGIQYPNNVKI